MSQTSEEGFSSVTQPISAHQLEQYEDSLDLLEYDINQEEVIQRIEHCAIWLLQTLSSDMLPDLVLKNPAPIAHRNQPNHAESSTQNTKVVSLVGPHVESADRYARIWTVLDHCHENLINSVQTTQRDFHYRFKPQNIFCSQKQLAESIEDVVLLLRVPRYALGIICSSKGLVYGPVSFFDPITRCTTECMLSQQQISGDIKKIKSFAFSTNARFVLIVEKDTIFQKLVSDPTIMNSPDIILITGKGVPDMATRVFVSCLHQAYPSLVLLGFVDWNPSGVLILNTYKNGSSRMIESRRYALPALKWLGLHSSWVSTLDADVLHSLTERDISLKYTLQESLQHHAWIDELHLMQQSMKKCDIEALYSSKNSSDSSVSFSLGHFLRSLINQQAWI